MRYITFAAGLAISGAALGLTFADDGGALPSQTLAMQQKESIGPSRSVSELRAAGPEGLRSILAAFARDPGSVSETDIDAVAQQHGAKWSRLYWYTDMDAATSAARAERKPILYLRMLGTLTDEYSCANSRFFRTVLYANEQVSHLLRERFVLVWQSERPVPVATIDYGDGRVLKRTITGNSIHYVLDADGNVVDALPGLYDPETFARALAAAHEAALSGVESKRRDHLQTVGRALGQAWEWELVRTGIALGESPKAEGAKIELESPLIAAAAPNAPDARDGAGTAAAKMRAELPMVRALTPTTAPAAATAPNALTAAGAPKATKAGAQAAVKRLVESAIVTSLEVHAASEPLSAAGTDPLDAASPVWGALAARRVDSVHLDNRSIALIRSQNPAAYAVPGALDRVLEQFRRSIAADTVRNDLLFRRQIIGWLNAAPRPIALEDLNRRVYAELFLTPRSDPWLGLVPDATYSALKDDGMCAAK